MKELDFLFQEAAQFGGSHALLEWIPAVWALITQLRPPSGVDDSAAAQKEGSA
jgi:hypothetical protein